MRIKTALLFLILSSHYLQAEDGHNLWFCSRSTASVNIVCKANSPTLSIAKKELLQGWQGSEKEELFLFSYLH